MLCHRGARSTKIAPGRSVRLFHGKLYYGNSGFFSRPLQVNLYTANMDDRKYAVSIDGEEEMYPVIYESNPISSLQERNFDMLLQNGWRFLGTSVLRHSFSMHYGVEVFTIPGRIRLANFYLSKSQRKLLRLGNRDLLIELGPKQVNASDEKLFELHKARFDDSPPTCLSSMVAYDSQVPCKGYAVRVYCEYEALPQIKANQHIATSFFHVGSNSADASYCIYDPSEAWAKYSLGNLTMLIEILHCQQLGLEYYYVGYWYNVPSRFDYKANFHGLERFKEFREWVPCARIPPRPLEIWY